MVIAIKSIFSIQTSACYQLEYCMNEKIVFVRTDSGEDEVRSRTALLSKDIKRALLMVDGTATVAEIMKRSSPSLRGMLEDMFSELAKGGFIQDKAKAAGSSRLVLPSTPKKSADKVDELDFTAAFRVPTQTMLAEEAAKVAEKARVQAEEQTQAREAAARVKAEQEAAEAQAHARAESARHARAAAEAARKAEQAEEQARAAAAAKAEATKAQALARLEAEALAKREAARVKAEQDRVREEVEQQRATAREELERRQADAARRVSEQEAAEARERAEAARKAEQAEEQARAAAAAKAEAAKAQALARLEAEALAKREAARVKAEQDRIREEVEQQRAAAREETIARQAEAARELAELEAIKAAAEQAGRLDRELAEQNKAEQARVKAGEDAQSAAHLIDETRLMGAETQHPGEAQTDMLAAVVRLNAKHAAEEDSVFSAMEEKAADAAAAVARGDSTEELVVARGKSAAAVPGGGSPGEGNDVPVVARRTIIAAVLFFDIIGYTKQPDKKQLALKHQFNKLVTGSLDSLEAGERIILDTGDGAAIGFLQHPTDALEAAIHFRAALIVNKHRDYPDLRVRVGIHLGPVSLVKDMNGQINMLGDGINSAQRVMSFAGQDQIYVSRAYFEFVSNLSDEYKELFLYRGAQQDKHKREHQVYELLGAEADEPVPAHEPTNNLAAFNFEAFDTALSHPDELTSPAEQQPVADQMFVADLGQTADVNPVRQEDAVRPVEEASPQYSETEARQLVDAQAKKWEEAEQRAAEAARRRAESVPQQVFQRPAEAVPAAKTVARPRRKPMPWVKLTAGLAALLVLALFAAPLVLPTQGYVASIEQALGTKLQQPVHIGRLSGRILPTPSLVLGDVYIGEAKQIQARQAQVNFSLFSLFGAVKSIDSIELDGVQVNGAALRQVSGWLQQTAADQRYPVRRIALTNALLDADGIQFSNVDGELTFDAAGSFTQARFNADGRKLALEIHAAPEQKLALSFTLRDSALPLLPNWVFEDMKAVGELTRDELRITELDSRIMGGVLTGDARINWRAGWRVQGALVAKVIPLQNINKLLSGDLDGSARFLMQADNLAKLADAAVLNGVFSVRKGTISGVDIVEVTRLRSRENLPGGRTHFNELSGELAYANESYQFRQLKLNDNVVKAFGSLTARRQELSGNISADLMMRPGAVALQVGGTTESPSLRVAN